MLSADRADLTHRTVDGGAPRRERAASPAPDGGSAAGETVQRDASVTRDRARATDSGASHDVSRQELALLAVAARARCLERSADVERVALLGEVYAAGLDLARQLRDHTLHSMAEYRGSHSAWDVLAESEALAAAKERYALVARRAAARLPALLASAQGPR